MLWLQFVPCYPVHWWREINHWHEEKKNSFIHIFLCDYRTQNGNWMGNKKRMNGIVRVMIEGMEVEILPCRYYSDCYQMQTFTQSLTLSLQLFLLMQLHRVIPLSTTVSTSKVSRKKVNSQTKFSMPVDGQTRLTLLLFKFFFHWKSDINKAADNNCNAMK